MRKSAFGLVLLISAALASSCASVKAPTRDQYVAVANQVCASATDTIAADYVTFYEENGTENVDAGTTERYIRFVLIKHVRAMIGQLASIAPPAGDGDYVHSIYADYAHSMDVSFSDPLGDSADASWQAAEKRLKDFGMDKCSGVVDRAGKKADKDFKAAQKAKAAGKGTGSASTTGATNPKG